MTENPNLKLQKHALSANIEEDSIQISGRDEFGNELIVDIDTSNPEAVYDHTGKKLMGYKHSIEGIGKFKVRVRDGKKCKKKDDCPKIISVEKHQYCTEMVF